MLELEKEIDLEYQSKIRRKYLHKTIKALAISCKDFSIIKEYIIQGIKAIRIAFPLRGIYMTDSNNVEYFLLPDTQIYILRKISIYESKIENGNLVSYDEPVIATCWTKEDAKKLMAELHEEYHKSYVGAYSMFNHDGSFSKIK